MQNQLTPEIIKWIQTLDIKLLRKTAEIVSQSSLSIVFKVKFDKRVFYIKFYFKQGKRWQRECQNLNFCANLNIPTPVLVYFKKTSRFFNLFFKQGIIVTEEIPNAIDLKKIAIENHSMFQLKSWRHIILKKIASYVAILHKHSFLHYDLQWRNILVSIEPRPQVYFFDMPSGKLRRFFFNFYKRRDFYNLYKSAVQFLSRSDQLRFYFYYTKTTHLTPQDKINLKRWIQYYRKKEFNV
jgi:tRNA A-37 threonylcarbamoyl transferase component Bud32